MNPRFQFYEIVKTKLDPALPKEVIGLEGAILGMAEETDGIWGYAVHIYALDALYDIREPFLEPTGRSSSREEFYDGSVLKVLVDPETGEGKIADRSQPAQRG